MSDAPLEHPDGLFPPIPANETERLRELESYHILDTLPEQFYEDIVRLAAYICQTPMALVNLIDRDRQWSKARLGFTDSEVDRKLAFCSYTINYPDDVFVVPDATCDERFAHNPFVCGDPYIRFYAGAPLVTPNGYALGTVCVVDVRPHRLTPEQIEMLRVLARQVVRQLELRRDVLALEQRLLTNEQEKLSLRAYLLSIEAQLAQAQQQALTDPLTGLLNRRGFEQRLQEEIDRSLRYNVPMALLMVDIDHFKAINDTFGHVAGDEILRMVAQLLRENVRRHDIVARYGGEEFAVILPATGFEGTPILGERIRRAVQQAAWPYVPVTISVGGACCDATMTNATDLLTAADHALYDAKRSGRNCCIVR
ncbi:sensor domain-containing diguanylate cyclase [Chloroflexus aggregans]|uniref:Diguanylate cyclase with GAF sensor n=1 Tax=Chloroflexus aggregans (strain MD-66 / DSM 9485) TaxID=326427 RepID=B8G5J8_CHLAD|nr:sensor domain-containing diguanylate cyclase [Chloroflexus aggregans]ACL23709.1 diguanylate cyclase with GAF sensor [Chloroflexus aggregans DSM 9485]